MGPENDNRNSAEDPDGGIFYLESQWDAINRGSQKDSLQSQKSQPQSLALQSRKSQPQSLGRDQISSIGGLGAERFFPNLPILSELSEYEFFENDSECVCKADETSVDTIAEAIFNLPDNVNPRLQPAGYTYFAQLLTHDIVPSTTLTRHAKTSPGLNLDSIYFEFSEVRRWGAVDDNGAFTFSCSDKDLRREEWTIEELKCEGCEVSDGRTEPYYFAIVPEHRNDGNAILAQLHLLIQKAHNQIVRLLIDKDSSKDGREYFEKAKEIVVLLFQHVCVDDLLQVTLDPDTFDYYFVHKRPSLFPDLAKKEIVPKEFTHAVSRYAHSMIRPRYVMNKYNGEEIPVGKIFAKNSRLPKELVIDDWDFFFDKPWPGNGRITNKAKKIELQTSKLAVSNGPIDERKNPSKNLAKFDISASIELCTFSSVMRTKKIRTFLEYVKGIKNVEGYFNRIDYSGINDELANLPGKNIVLDNTNSPFLISMLLESRAMPQVHNKDRLGVVGSIIYAETVRMSINKAEINIYQSKESLKKRLDWGYSTYQRLLISINPMSLSNLAKLNF
jgi:hypothetical protein